MTGNTYNSTEYGRNRAQILQSKPMCVYCHTQPATTVDHVIEVDRGGSHALENLVPSCGRCNFRRGAQYGNAKRSAIARARAEAVQASENKRKNVTPPTPKKEQNTRNTVFGGPDASPEPASLRISPKPSKKAPSSRKAAPKPANPDLSAARLETPYLGDSSYGPRVAAWAHRHLGIELMPWQIQVLDGLLAHDDAGHLLHRTGLVSVARQNGKTVALKALVGWWLTEGPVVRGSKQEVISTAHALDLAVALFQDLAPILEEHFGAKAKWSYGRNELEMPDGSRWYVRAATPSAGHGRSPDLIVIDELWDVSDDVVDQGLIPSQRARKSPLCAMWSTAGTEASRAMLRWREQGLQAIDNGRQTRHYFAEWSPPPSADLTDPEMWRYANPALGHTLELETLIAESEAPNRAAFLRASLNLWVASDQSWLDPGTWEKLVYPDQLPPATVLAVEHSLDESRYVGLTAHPHGEKVILQTAFIVRTEQELWREVPKHLPSGAQLALPPSLDIHAPPELGTRKTTVGYGELVRWTGLVRSMIYEGRILHTGENTLAEHMARAVASRTQAGVVLSSQKSPGPIELARCAVWAAALASKAKWSTRPAIGRARR